MLNWLVAHPYANGALTYAISDEAGDPPFLDVDLLTSRTRWFGTPISDKFSLAEQHPPVCSALQNGRPVYGVGWKDQVDFYNGDRFAFDWVSALFFWLARWEERLTPGLSVNPPRATDHWLVRYGLEREPRADRLAEAVLRAFGIGPAVEVSTTFVTHDLDHLRMYQRPWSGLRFSAYVRRKGGSAASVLRTVTSYVQHSQGTAPDPFDNPGRTIGPPRGGVLYLLLGRHVREDGGLDYSDDEVQRWIRAATSKGLKIGLHPSYTVPTHPERLAAELERFAALCGYLPLESRQHFLRWDWTSTPELLTEAGIGVDSSLGFRDRLGFRCGTSFTYPLYSFATEAVLPLRERPLAVMDTAWMERNAWNPARCVEDWDSFRKLNAFGAQLVVNIHNSSYALADALGIDLDVLREIRPSES